VALILLVEQGQLSMRLPECEAKRAKVAVSKT